MSFSAQLIPEAPDTKAILLLAVVHGHDLEDVTQGAVMGRVCGGLRRRPPVTVFPNATETTIVVAETARLA